MCLTNLPDHGYPKGILALQEFYVNHTKRIRDFVTKYPSHTLVEVNIEDQDAGRKLADSFGLDDRCWTRYNSVGDRKRKAIKNLERVMK
eukprot:CAMPEP_0113325106 /NCGR_PEP_ID=MMETSP0010_2-20120614/17513_1 /TAXON_ID=216773 ORGANISM="Corethron hystrix, Strain 308" /NCGR_SAMPLE_ID=MMETSP0010_2 /ASSEMBLY_ACC=CAM_ASM_000155 /LENGTH=88 /DNA_ID=CAMNT_0000184753 /DNA_START=648 /DNA_END=911 /DNA_ORIENTATION=- /assembly_acc=CAM_ASM_000155